MAPLRHCNTYSDIGSKYFFQKKKYVAISPRSGAHAGERNLLLSARKGLCCKNRRTLRPWEVFKDSSSLFVPRPATASREMGAQVLSLMYVVGCGAGAGEASPSASPPSSSDSPLGDGGFAGRSENASSRRSSSHRFGARSRRACPARGARGPPPIGLMYVIGCGAGAGKTSLSASPPSSSDSPLGGGGFAGRPVACVPAFTPPPAAAASPPPLAPRSAAASPAAGVRCARSRVRASSSWRVFRFSLAAPLSCAMANMVVAFLYSFKVVVRFPTFVTSILGASCPSALGAHVCAHRALRQPSR